MIRTSQDEFFIEPLDRRRTGEEEGEGEGRRHIVYRSSAIVKKQPAVTHSAADFLRGELSAQQQRLWRFITDTG